MAATDSHITGLWMQAQKHFAASLPCDAQEKENPILAATQQCLQRYFAGEDISSEIPPLLPKGTAFQQEVWSILMEIPYGQTVTYGQISKILEKRLGLPAMSPQAVGNAVGRNPISILIPCHRVVGSNGRLSGYAGGISRKVFLLELEQRNKA